MSDGEKRNWPCWCGSGLKYKKCHLGRENDAPMAIEEAIKLGKRITAWETCLHPEAASATCSGIILKAHTIQRSGGLTRIARNGHVYWMPTSFMAFKRNEGRAVPVLTGINKASTFTGFCGKHDSQLFRPIESRPLSFEREHAFLLGYRALCRELYAKEQQARMIPFLRRADRGVPKEAQVAYQGFMQAYEAGTMRGLASLRGHKKRFDACLAKSDWSDVHYYWIELETTPELLCSGAIYPEYDFSGKALQDLTSNSGLDITCFSSVPADAGKGALVFTWLGDQPASRDLASSLERLPRAAIPHALVRLIFEFFENTCMHPDWWEGLSEHDRQSLLDRLNYSIDFDQARDPRCLVDDGLRVVRWSITDARFDE